MRPRPTLLGFLCTLALLVLGVVQVRGGVESWSLVHPVLGSDLYGVVRGDAGWVTVGDAGTIGTSADGRRWITRSAGTSANLGAVVFGSSRYLAAGSGGLVLSSADGVTWTQVRSADGSSSVRTVGAAHGNGRFIVVQSDGRVLASADGSTWTVHAMPSSANGLYLRAVAFGNGVFVAVGSVGSSETLIYSSSDGATWTRRAQGIVLDEDRYVYNARLLAVTYGGEQFVAVGESNAILTSPDGANWIARRSPYFSSGSSTYASVAYGNGIYVIGLGSSYLSSVDGHVWARTTQPEGPGAFSTSGTIAFGGGAFVAVGSAGSTTIKTATDEWTPVAAQLSTSGGGVAYGNGRFLQVGPGGFATSPDGVEWQSRSNSQSFAAPLFANGKFWATAGLIGGDVVLNSVDGLAWTTVGSNSQLGKMLYARGKYVVAGSGGMSSSSDGVTWSRHSLSSGSYFNDLAEGGGRFVAVGYPGALATSETGSDWTLRSPGFGPTTMAAVAFGAGRFVAVPLGSLQPRSSSDGLTWSTSSLPTPTGGFSATGFSGLIYRAGRFVANVGTDIVTSTDGLNWTVFPRALAAGLSSGYALSYGNGRFLATNGYRVLVSTPDETAIAINSATDTVLVPSGQAPSLSVSATGPGLTFQWYRGTTGDTANLIAGATSTTYVPGEVTADAAFWVRVSSATTYLDSATMNVRLTQAPAIFRAPAHVEFTAGQTPTLAVGATGVMPPGIQWYRGGSGDASQPWPSAMSTTFSPAGLAEPSRFWARATNASGSADSTTGLATPWVAKTPNAPAEQMIFANGLYVAVAGSIVTSPDGVTWTRRHTPAPGYSGVKRIAYGNGRFVAMGNDRQMISTDGITWTTTDRSSIYRTYDWLVFGNGVFLSNFAGSNALMASTDGVTWTARTLPSGFYFGDVVFEQGKFIALAENYETSTPIYTSVDGVTWQARAVPWSHTSLGSSYRLAAAGSKIFAHISGQLYNSPDGITWSGASSTSVAFTQVAYGNGVFVAGSTNYTPTLYRSMDGVNWSGGTVQSAQSSGCVVFAGGRFLTAGSTGNVHASTDGLNWTSEVAWPGQPVGSLVYGKGRWVATGSPVSYQYSRSAAYYSTDGNKWISVTGSVEFSGRAIFAKNKFYSASPQGGVLVSTDGSAWNRLSVSGVTGAFAAIVEVGERLVAIGSGWTASSLDGVTWTGSASNASYVERAVYGNGLYIGHGSGVPLRSPDGITWLSGDPQISGYAYPSLNSLAFGAGVFVVVGEYGSIYTSSDGVTWTPRSPDGNRSNATLVDVLYAGGRFIATSADGYHTSIDGITWTRSQFTGPTPAGVVGDGAGKLIVSAFPAVMESVPDPAYIGISQQPVFQAVSAGQSATFSIVAISTPNLRYQWQKNGVAIAGATNASLVLANAQTTDSADYRVLVSNAPGASVLSAAVPLYVNPAAPTVVSGPATKAVNTGSSVTLSVTASGNPAPRYQWNKNGVPVPGATAATLTWPRIATTDAASYSVSLANLFGTATSAPAVISVATLLIASNVQPTVGGAALLSVDAVAGATYQWRRRGTPIAGATAATLPLTALSRSQNGFYDVVLTYPAEAVTAFGYALDAAPNPLPNFYTADLSYAPRLERAGEGMIRAVLRLPDGKFLVGGNFTSLDGAPRAYLARLHGDGTLDSGYTPPVLTGSVEVLTALADGKIIIGGDFAFIDGRPCGHVARLGSDLTADVSFSAGTGCNGTVYAIATQSDGRLVLAGAFSEVNGFYANRVARLAANGAVDAVFSSTMGSRSFPYNMAAGRVLLALPDGKWLVGGGQLYDKNVSASGYLVRINADGGRDGTFNVSSIDDANGPVLSLLRQSDGKIVAAGALNYQNVSSQWVTRFAANGEPDTSFAFDQSLVPAGGHIEHLIDAGDGKFLIAGKGVPPTRLTSTGARDGAFGALPYASATLTALTPLGGGSVRLWGSFRAADASVRTGFSVLGVSGNFSEPVGPAPRAEAAIYWAEIASEGKLLVRGSFTHVESVARAGLVRFLADGRTDPAFNLGGQIPVADTGRFVVQGDGRILVHDGTKLLRLLPDGPVDSSFAPVTYTPAALILDRNGSVVVSNSAEGGVFGATTGLRRFLTDGTPDASFANPVVSGYVGELTTYLDGRFLMWGPFHVSNSTKVCLFLDGTNDTSFGSLYSSWGQSLPLATFVNGDAFSSGSLYVNLLSLFPIPSYAGSVYSGAGILPLPGRGFIVAAAPHRENTAASFLKKYSAEGVQNTAFLADGLAVDTNRVDRMLLQDDGSIVLLGSALSAFGAPRFGIMRLAPAAVPTIVAAPVSVQAAVGASVTFSVAAAGTGPLTYQWYRNGIRIVGATTASLVLNNLAPVDVPKFTVKITNGFGTATSLPVTISGPNPAPTVVTSPASLLVTTGHPATFSVGATGVGLLTYQWRRSGYRIPGATAATFTQPHASRTDAGLYDVVVSDGLSVTVSSGARLDVAPSSYGNTLEVDPSFAPKFEAAGGVINAIVPTADGKFIVSGEFTRLNGVECPGFARVDAEFRVDTAFAPPVVFADVASASFSQISTTRVHAVQPDGKILVTQPLPSLGDYPYRNRLVRLQDDGTPDPAFTASAALEHVVRLALQPDGKIIVIGQPISTPLPAGKRYVHRLNSDGSLDAAYTPEFLSSSSQPSAPTFVVVQPDGKALFGGGYVTIDGKSANALVRLTSSGAVDPTFQFTGVNSTFVTAAAVLPDGRLIVGGAFTTPSFATARLGRIGVNGAWEAMLLSSSDAYDNITKISLHSSGKIWASFASYNSATIWRVSAAGVAEKKVSISTTNFEWAHAPAEGDRLLATSEDFSAAGLGAVRFAADGARENVTAQLEAQVGVQAAVAAPGGKLLVAGGFTRVNGAPQKRIARLFADGALDATFAVGEGFDGAPSTILALPDGGVLVSGSFTRFGSSPTGSFVRLKASGALDPSFAPALASASTGSLALMVDGRVLAGGAACFLADGTRDPGFQVSFSSAFAGVPLADGNVIFGVSPTNSSSIVYRVRPDGTTDRVGNSGNSPRYVAGIAVQPDGKVITGAALTVLVGNLGVLRPDVRRHHAADLSRDTSFATDGVPLPLGTTSAYRGARVLPQEDGRILVNDYYGFVRLNTNGTLDSSFAPPKVASLTGSATTVRGLLDVLVLDDGRLMLADQFMSVGGLKKSGLIRLRDTAGATFAVQPADRAVFAGQEMMLSATATGPGPLAYQWFKNGTAIAGATGAAFSIPTAVFADAGSYAVTVTNANGPVWSAAALVSVAAPIAPTIIRQPRSQAAFAGGDVQFSVEATGTPAPSLRWFKDGQALSGATGTTLQLRGVQAVDVADYSVTVSNVGGQVTSAAVHLTLLPTGVVATHEQTAASYAPVPTVTVTNTFSYAGAAPGVTWQVLLPAGYSLVSTTAGGGVVAPPVGATDLAEWTWSAAPPSPVVFTYTLRVPVAEFGPRELAALVTFRPVGGAFAFLAKPDPLVIRHRHSADTNRDLRFSLTELTRVIEIYNTRSGSARSGAYAVAAAPSEDGFEADFSRGIDVVRFLTAYHTADTNQDGNLSLFELTRVIELYNARSGTTRTGTYHVAAGTEDGFAPGP